MTDRQYSDGEYIYKAGDAAEGVFRVRSGAIRLQRDGEDMQPGTPGPGAGRVFGDRGFLTGEPRDTDAIAVGDVVVEFLRRNEFLAILTVQPNLLSPLFDPVFDLVRTASGATTLPQSESGHPDITGNGSSRHEASGEPVLTPLDIDIRLLADGRRLRSLLGTDEVAVRVLPFRIGRAASGEGKDTYGDVHLTIEDARPFNLSRRHFSIEHEDGALIVRDCGSYHGTTLNGQALGGEGRPISAPLMTGESELIAGRSDSPFRFRILVQ